MHEKNFENEVRQKMEELAFTPSPPVWEKVAERIKKKRDRRRIIFWILPLLLLSGGFIWWSLSINEKSGNTAISEKIISNKDKNTTVKNEPVTTATSGTTTITATQQNTKPKTSSTHKVKTFVAKGAKAVISRKSLTKTSHQQKPLVTKQENIKLQPAKKHPAHPDFAFNRKDKEPTEPASTTTDKKPVMQIQDTANTSLLLLEKRTENRKEETGLKDTVRTPEIIKGEAATTDTANKTEVPGIQKTKKKKDNKLQFSIVVHVGTSALDSGLFGFLSAEKALMDLSSSSSFSPGSSIVQLPPQVQPPSQVTKGLAYSAGFHASKKISRKSSFSLGLRYDYYSTKIRVGARVDSATTISNTSNRAGSYYRNTNRQTDYTNQYHFISLPLSYGYQLLKKRPLYVGAGLSLGRLVSSNALHYNNTLNGYYQDNSLLHKIRIDINGNINYQVWKHRDFSLVIGPQYKYGLTSVLKNNTSNRQHLFSVGINTQVNFQN